MKDTYAAGEGSGEEAPKVSQLCSYSMLFSCWPLHLIAVPWACCVCSSALLLPEFLMSSSLHHLGLLKGHKEPEEAAKARWSGSSPAVGVQAAPASMLTVPFPRPLQAFASVNWVLSEEQFDLETDLAFSFLDYLLLGTSAAPLRRALMESGLGESMIGGGLSGELRQPIFSLGLKGVAPDNADKVSAAADGVCRCTHTLAPLPMWCHCSSSWCPGCG